MKSLIIFLLLILFGCSSSTLYNKHPFIFIEFDMPDKYPLNEDIPIKFKITNNENIDIILEKNYLAFYWSLSDSCFRPLRSISTPDTLRGEWVILLEPITIKKNSQVTIESGYISFKGYNFEPDQIYIIQAKYQNYDSYSDSTFTFIGEIGPYLKKIKFYKQ